MKKDSRINFVMLDILDNWRFWNQYAKTGDYEAAGREVISQAEALLEQDFAANKRAAELLTEGLEFKRKKIEAGRLGGLASAEARRPRKNPNSATASGKSADVLPLCGGSTPAGAGLSRACSRPGRGGIGRNGNVFIDPGELAAIEAEYGDVAPAIDEISDILANDPERYRNHAAQLRRVLAVRRKEGRAPDGHKITQEERLAAHFAAQAMAENAGKETINHKPQPQIRKAKNERRIDRKSEAAAAERALCESLGVASLESV